MSYLDCNASTPVDPRVVHALVDGLAEVGNAASGHSFGRAARERLDRSRDSVASLVDRSADSVLFTSGATEANNLAILGLRAFASKTGRKHIVSTSIEHPSVLEPLALLEREGFEVERVDPGASGCVSAAGIAERVRDDTLLVSVMHANNVTGMLQPIDELAGLLADHQALLHVDGAQSFGKTHDALRSPRIDLLSVSAHKVYAPTGIGALIASSRAQECLEPLLRGGAHERGLRAGTQAVALALGFGLAAQLAAEEGPERHEKCQEFREGLFAGLAPLAPRLLGEEARCQANVACLAFEGIEAESAIAALADVVAVSTGSACASGRAEPSHVFTAMGVDPMIAESALRFSWYHGSVQPPWELVQSILRGVRV